MCLDACEPPTIRDEGQKQAMLRWHFGVPDSAFEVAAKVFSEKELAALRSQSA